MIINTTHHNPEHRQIIADLIGGPFSLVQKLKMKGVGSKRMIIDEVSPNMQSMMNKHMTQYQLSLLISLLRV